MFEKCGLRDLFCGFVKWKWIIAALTLVLALIGGVLYARDMGAYNAKKEEAHAAGKVYSGYGYYYIAPTAQEKELTLAELNRYSKSYIDLMLMIPSRLAILNTLEEKHTPEELIELLDPVRYADGVTRDNIWEGSYYLEKWSSPNILRLKTLAQTKEMCKEVMAAADARLMAIAKDLPDTTLSFEGSYFKKVDASKVVMSDEKEEKNTKPSPKSILIFALIGLAAGLLLSVIISVLRPVLNRASDFELYSLDTIGEVRKKTVPLLARVLDRKVRESGVKKIVFATSRKKGAKTEEFCRALCEEWNRLGTPVSFNGEGEASENEGICLAAAVCPDQDAAASDLCAGADLVIAAEEKGRSRHIRLDEMLHYLELIKASPKSAVLIA